MNQWNELLPSIVRDGLHHDEQESLKQINKSVAHIRALLNGNGELVSNKDAGKLFRQINTHSSLKYIYTSAFLDTLLNLLMDLYLSNHSSLLMKTSALHELKSLCKRANCLSLAPTPGADANANQLTFRFSYLPLWTEILKIVNRESREVAASSEHVLSDYLTAMVDFLHGARQYIRTDVPVEQEDSIKRLVEQSMIQLQDLRYPVSIQGLLALVNCLPTDYKHYDKLLPRWVELWVGKNHSGGMDHNAHWDYAWLTLLARARKHCPEGGANGFSWQSLLPLLISKAAELMQIPASAGVEGVSVVQSNEFPHAFPAQYARILLVQSAQQNGADARTMALKKLAKLLHFVTSAYVKDDAGNVRFVSAMPLSITPPEVVAAGLTAAQVPAKNSNEGAVRQVLPGAVDMMLLFQSLRTYFYPSNTGHWTHLQANFFLTYVLQLCRHVGHSLASTVTANTPVSLRYLPALHLPTLQYLVTNLLPFALEGLYSKHPHLSQYSSACIKNLVAVYPSVCGPIVLPFLLAALDPSAVSQAHQAPIAMQTISGCFRGLMYPQPVLLPYLPDILRLSLPGIEPSDVMKTSITLNLYCTILAWVPTTLRDATSKDSVLPSYLEVLQASNQYCVGAIPSATAVSIDTLNAQMSELSEYMSSEWCNALISRLFAVLEAQEVVVEGAKPSPLDGAVGQVASYLFQALRPLPGMSESDPAQQKQTTLRLNVQTQVRKFFNTTTPLNGVKGSAKLVEAMVTSDPSILHSVLTDLLVTGTTNTDIVTSLLHAYSADKVAFKLRLAGGACRAATSTYITPVIDLLQPILTSALFFNHDEKIVRTATNKLLKDVLKGSSSLYPTALEPVYGSNADKVVGYPQTHSGENIKWHVPSSESLQKVTIPLLRNVVTDSITDLLQSITDASNTVTASASVASTASSNEDLTQLTAMALGTPVVSTPATVVSTGSTNATTLFKKAEELIVSKLNRIEKALRGAAEVLGDNYHEQNTHQEVSSKEGKLLSTGRETLIESLMDPEDSLFLTNLRSDVLVFLNTFQDTLHSVPSTHPYSALKNNITIQSLWLNIFNHVVNRRMACLKDVDNLKKYMKYSLKVGRSSISNVVYHRVKAHLLTTTSNTTSMDVETSAPHTLLSLDYWRAHDQSSSGIACMAWIKYIQRCKSLASQALRTIHSSITTTTLSTLVHRLCMHEYDQIRHVALKQFDHISAHFGAKNVPIIQHVLQLLQKQSDLQYWAVSGALSLLSNSRVQRRVLGDAALMQTLLQTILLQSQTVILSATDEADKREKLMLKVVDVLLKYVKRWCAIPALSPHHDVNFMLQLALRSVGYGENDSLSSVGGAIVTNDASVKNVLGLRFETFAAFMVLHVVGRPAAVVHHSVPTYTTGNTSESTLYNSALWQWAISTSTNAQQHGQPAQAIALGTLTRLASLAKIVTTGTSTTTANTSTLDVARTLLSPTSTTHSLRALVLSASQAHPRTGEDGTSAQWGSGIDQVLQAAQFLRTVAPRRFNGLIADQGFFSKRFKKEDAYLYKCLAEARLLCSEAKDMFTSTNIAAIFTELSDLPFTNESEARLNNTTKAEVFAGLLRAYRGHASAHGADTAVDGVFLQALKDGFEKGSLDYAKDWAEAVSCAYSDHPIRLSNDNTSPSELIPQYALERLVQGVLLPTATSNTTAGAAVGASATEMSADTSGESFATQSKALQLTSALLQADQQANYLAGTTSSFGTLLGSVLQAQSELALISPYRSTRNDLAYLLFVLTENSLTENAVTTDLCLRIATACSNSALAAASTVTSDNATDSVVEDGASANSPEAQLFKNAAETVCLVLRLALQNLPLWRLHEACVGLFRAALIGAGSMTSSAIETAKLCHNTCLLVANTVLRTTRVTNGSSDLTAQLLQVLLTTAQDPTTPLHSRETLMQCVSLLMGNNWYMLNNDERKICKDIFSLGIDDIKPEVQLLAVAGMVAYLATYKTVTELGAIAAVYTKNSDILAAREKKLKKTVQADGSAGKSSVKADPKHQNTVLMMSCVILATPYDLPAAYLPALLTSFVRHAGIASLKVMVTRTVQLFRQTHQDRWEEFKKAFSVDQLDELQGTGAAHYYS